MRDTDSTRPTIESARPERDLPMCDDMPAVPGEVPLVEEMERSLPAIVADRAAEHPNAVAVEDGERILTYAELDAAGAAVASALLAAGVGPGTPVAVCLPRSWEAVVAFLGILRAGAAYVPISPAHPERRQRRIVELAGARIALSGPEHDAGLPREIVRLDVAKLVATPASPSPELPPGGDRLAYVLFTSGSTGEPKGVEVTHRNLVHLLRSSADLIPRASDTVLHVDRLEFDMSGHELWGALLNGARLVVAPWERPDPLAIGRLIAERGVTFVNISIGLLHELVHANVPELGRLRVISVGGDVFSPAVARTLRKHHPHVRVINGYGPTEATIVASSYEVIEPGSGSIPIGRPLPGYRLYVLDEAGVAVEPGEAGELWIGGPGVALGYRGDPERTAERFQTNPFDAGRIYRTGDRVRLRDDGELLFEGRLDRQVKVSGQRIELGEIEQVLATHPEVSEVAVVAREDVPGHKRLVGYAVPTAGGNLSPAALSGYLSERLPHFMVPSPIVILDVLPRSERGKVDRDALPSPTRGDFDLTPVTGMIGQVTSAMAEVLRLESVSADENFFELGGDSLLAIRLAGRLRERLGVDLEIGVVFAAPTASALTELIEGHTPATPNIPPLLPATRASTAPASFAQRRTWLFGLMHPESIAYQSAVLLQLDGSLDEAALAGALSDLMQRHESLRTSFEERDGEPVQVIHTKRPLPLETVDLRGAGQSAWEQLLQTKVRTRIDPGHAPLVRWTLVRLEEEAWALIHVEHHLILDGCSFAVLVGELAELYSARVEERTPDLPEAIVQFQDYTHWERALEKNDAIARQLEHWVRTLDRDPPLLELPLDRPRPLRESFSGGSIRLRLEPEAAARLRTLAHAEGSTLFMAAFAAFATQLHRYTGRSDLQIGSGLANRREPASERLLGMIVNTVIFRFDLAGDPTVRELLRRVRSVALDAYANADAPFDAVVEAVRPPRDPQRSPLFNILFSFNDPPRGEERWSGLRARLERELPNGTAKADLDIIGIDDHDGGITFVWEHSDLFFAATAERMARHHLSLIEEFSSRPDARISELDLIPSDESRQLASWSNGEDTRGYERNSTIADLFEARVAEDARAVAVSFQGETLSYGRLDRRANRLAHHLRELGIDRGARVGVFLERSLDMIVTFLAIVKAGGAYVPLDPDDAPERLRRYAQMLDLRLIVTDARHRPHVPGPPDRVTVVDELVDLAREPDTPPTRSSEPLDAAYVMFTSGSTGIPKGVEVPHRAIVRLVRGADYVRLDAQETILGMAPAAFDASTFEIWGALLNGAKLVLAPPGTLTLGELAELVAREKVSTVWLTAGLFHLVVDNRPELLGSLRQLLAGGDVLSPDHVRRALAGLPEGAVLINGYGPTEATTFTCTHRMTAGASIDGSVPIGRPVAGSSVYILDAHGSPAPIGVAGELYIGGDGVALGYAGDPELTAQRFLPDPFSAEEGARMYRSGDLARWRADGTIEFLGRTDRQLKIRGFRVEPGEIEQALRSHPDVADGYVASFESTPGERALAAYVVPSAGAELREAELRAHAARLLPPHAIPVAWCWLERLPLTGVGKVDAAALPAPIIRSRRSVAGRPASPRDEFERELIAIWKRTLDCDAVDPEDDFFDLGGHSLLAVELFDAIERSLGQYLPLSTIFEAPTVRRLAAVLMGNSWEGTRKSLVPVTRSGSRPPLFCVSAGDGNPTGFGALARRLGDDQPLFALQPRGISGGAPLHVSVEAMARHYVREIRKVCPHGPYLLAGRCLGALIAYEMARRLEAARQRVRLLVVMDSGGPLQTRRRLADGTSFDLVMGSALRRSGLDVDVFSLRGTEEFMRWLAEPVHYGGDETPPINRYLEELYRSRSDVRDVYPDLAGEDARGFIDWTWISGRPEEGLCERLLPPPSDPSLRSQDGSRKQSRFDKIRERLAWRAAEARDLVTGGRLPGAGSRLRERIRDVGTRAALGYRAGAYGGVVTLIRSAEYRVHTHLDRWFNLDTGGVVEAHVSGTHRSMLREPDVASLAESIRGLIDAAIDERDEKPSLEAPAEAPAAR
ncbi:MAG: amino acid adenylation domain-containing protein [Gaiellaceae bacterium]